MTRVLVDKMPSVASECPFAEYIEMTSKHKCIFQHGMYSRCDIECGNMCCKLIDVAGLEQETEDERCLKEIVDRFRLQFAIDQGFNK